MTDKQTPYKQQPSKPLNGQSQNPKTSDFVPNQYGVGDSLPRKK